MYECHTNNLDQFENDENIPINDRDVRWRLDEEKDCSGSQEMFSDDDQPKGSPLKSPLITRNCNISVSSFGLKTPVLDFKAIEETPGKAKIPTTPAGLAPFITKTDLVWTSDLETPESKSNEKPGASDRTLDSIDIIDKTPLKQLTPKKRNMDIKKHGVSSPILGKKRLKKKVKKCKRLILDADNNNERQDSVGSNSDKVPSETASSASNELENEQDLNELTPKEEIIIPVDNECRENKRLEDAIVTEKNSNTSTQDFFGNASFSSIDQLCSNAIAEEKSNPSIKTEEAKDNNIEELPRTKEEAKTTSVSNEVLAKVALIRRNQKPLRRHTEVIDSPVPKEVFSRTLLQLDQADKEFGKEIKPIREPLKSTSFNQLSSFKTDEESEKIQEVIATSTDSSSSTKINEKCSTMHGDSNSSNQDQIPDNDKINLPSKRNDKPRKLQLKSNVTKEQQRPQQQQQQQPQQQPPEIKTENEINLPGPSKGNETPDSETLKLYEDLELGEFLIPKISSEEIDIKQEEDDTSEKDICSDFTSANLKSEIPSTSSGDLGFTTAGGKGIQISDDQENRFLQIYKEMDDVDDDALLNIKKNKKSTSHFPQKPTDKAVIIFNNSSNKTKNQVDNVPSALLKLESNEPSTSSGDFSFTTAGGKGIQISEDQENRFQQLYNQLDDIDDDALLKIKKKKDSKPNFLQKPTDKAVIIFNNSNNKKNNEVDNIPSDLVKLESNEPSTSSGDFGFTTAGGKGIQISDDQENRFQQIYNQLDDIDDDSLLKIKKKKDSKHNILQKPTDKAILVFNNNYKTSVTPNNIEPIAMEIDSSDVGFSTAKGKSIRINNDQESYFEKMYNELDDVDEDSLLNIKKNKTSKPSVLPKPTDKAVLVFNKEKNDLSGLPSAVIKLEVTEPGNLGFSTAGGKNIQISDEQESRFLNLYNEMDDVDEDKLLNIKMNKKSNPISTVLQKPKDKAVLVFNNKENTLNNVPSTTVKQESYSSGNTGFATAGGKGIQIDEEKENLFEKLYNEMDDADEDSLLNIKKNKQSKSNFPQKPTDKAVLVFNKKENKANTLQPVKVKAEFQESSSVGFSTAKGKDIQISDEKENHYLKIYNSLDNENDQTNSDSNRNRNRLSTLDADNRAPLKSVVSFNGPANKTGLSSGTSQSSTYASSMSFASCSSKSRIVGGRGTSDETDAGEVEIGDLAEFFSPPHQTQTLDCDEEKSHFVIPNSSNILQKEQLSESIKKELIDEDDIFERNKNRVGVVATSRLEPPIIFENVGREVKNLVGAFRNRLENCEVKRTERCRSFGGFPHNNQDTPTAKLNKSDPVDDAQTLSMSQCFDPHTDSLLSKLEISHLNGSKIIVSPDVKAKPVVPKVEQDSKDFLGFSFQDCTESMRERIKFERFLNKQIPSYDDITDINIAAGKSVSIVNSKTSPRNIRVLGALNKRKNGNQYDIVDNVNVPKKVVKKSPVKQIVRPKIDITSLVVNGRGAEKRKHTDTDDDTPLTSVKKPRVGTEIMGRKLFSDDSDEEVENDKMELEEDEPVPLVDTPVELTPEEEEALSQQRTIAISKQEKVIKSKKRMKIKPSIGSLLKERLANTKNRVSWSTLVNDAVPVPRSIEQMKRSHSDTKLLEVTAANATCYKFLTSSIVDNKRVASIDVDDGAVLIFDKDGNAGVAEFTDAFLAMPGVDPNLVPAGWVENHYGWIVWKLASMDRINFKSMNLSKMLTLERVMKELKYRYDREIDAAQRPALRKILEKDDVPSRRMVLCISLIKECVHTEESEKEARTLLGLPRWRVEATDGWYSIPLTLDAAMASYIASGKIKEGTKIITYGAELMECERGFFPLEKPPNVSLKIHTNSTRRARWDTKLGYQKSPKPLPVKLRDIISSGGMIGEITAVAARVYPVLYREKMSDGKSIYRNARSEEKAAIAHERSIEKKLDAMYADAQKNFDSKKKSDSDEDLETSQNSKSQTRTNKMNHYERKQEEFKQKLESQMRQSLPPKRNVTAVLKVRLAYDDTTVILTIWGASEDSDCDIKEGDTITVYNSYASGTRHGDVNLTANRMTHIKTEPLLRLSYPKRFCTLIPDVGALNFEPKYHEFDTVGLVVSAGAAPYGMKNFEMVNLAYPKPNNTGTAYMTVLFWDGIAAFGYQGLFTPGTFVACSNLEWRRSTAWSIPVGYCSEKTVFTSNPKQSHLVKELRNLKTLVQHPIQYAESCLEEVTTELSKKPQPRSNQATPTSMSFHNNSTLISPMDNCTPGNSMLQRRIAKLSQYGSSPEISPMVLNTNSARLKKDFTPVVRKSS